MNDMMILVVDDSEDTVQMLCFFLEQSVAAVTTANSAAEALKVAAEGIDAVCRAKRRH